MEFPILSTARLTLREHKQCDKEHYYELMSNPAAVRYYGRPPLKTPSEVDKEFENIRDGFEKSEYIKWAVELNDTHSYIGSVGVWGLNNHHSRGTISCIISPEYWGKGVGGEVLDKMIKYLFAELHINRLQLYVDPANERAVALFRKVGFQTEGVLREYEHEYGAFIDIAIMSILRKDML